MQRSRLNTGRAACLTKRAGEQKLSSLTYDTSVRMPEQKEHAFCAQWPLCARKRENRVVARPNQQGKNGWVSSNADLVELRVFRMKHAREEGKRRRDKEGCPTNPTTAHATAKARTVTGRSQVMRAFHVPFVLRFRAPRRAKYASAVFFLIPHVSLRRAKYAAEVFLQRRLSRLSSGASSRTRLTLSHHRCQSKMPRTGFRISWRDSRVNGATSNNGAIRW